MNQTSAPSHLVVISTPDGERSFTVSGLSGEEVRVLLAKASEGRFFKVIELDTAQQQSKALSHLSDATGALAILFVVSAFLIRRLQRWMQR